jgi:uncharacterized membrane protein YhaH (DUF805 family)
MFEAVSETYENLTDINGRITRKQFWSTFLANYAVAFFALFISDTLYTIIIFPLIVINIIIGIKRAHDVGYGGWVILVPLFNFIVFISNSADENKWGPPVN